MSIATRTLNTLKKASLVSFSTAIVGGIATLLLMFYSIARYPNTLLTTDPEFQHLSNADPILWNFIIIAFAICLVAGGVAYFTRKGVIKLYEEIKSRR